MSCNRFEELFVKECQKELLEHIMHCQECRYEYEKMQKTEKVLKEAKPYFQRQKIKMNHLKAVICVSMLLILSVYSLQNNFLNRNSNDYLATHSSVTVDSDIPVDEYGLVDID